MRFLYWLRHRYWLATSASYRAHIRECKAWDAEVERLDATGTLLVGGQVVHNVHPETACAGQPCCIHNPSDHHMAEWTQNWRDDVPLMERICSHGIGHPDPDHMRHLKNIWSPMGVWAYGVHGCDGCCQQRYSLDSVAAELGVDLDG